MKMTSFLLGCLLLATLSCTRQDLAQPSHSADTSFDFEIQSLVCTAGDMAYEVVVPNPKQYAYLWEVDGKPLGHSRQTPCLCGNFVQVRVMRLEDGKSLRKVMQIPYCTIN